EFTCTWWNRIPVGVAGGACARVVPRATPKTQKARVIDAGSFFIASSQRRFSGSRVFVDGDREEAADRVRIHDGDHVHRSAPAVELHDLRERRGVDLLVGEHLSSEANHDGVFLIDAGERALPADEVE